MPEQKKPKYTFGAEPLPPGFEPLPPRKEVPIGPDLSTVDREISRLLSGYRSIVSPPPGVKWPYPPDFVRDPYYDKVKEYREMGLPGLKDLVEEYKGIVPNVLQGVTSIAADFPPGYLNNPSYYPPELVSAMGAFSPKTRSILINPLARLHPYSPTEFETTLAHELAHAAGHGHNRHLYNVEGLGRMRAEAKELWKKGVK